MLLTKNGKTWYYIWVPMIRYFETRNNEIFIKKVLTIIFLNDIVK